MVTMARDITASQFRAALDRHGFRWALFGVQINRAVTIGAILSRRDGEWKLDRRATLAKALREAKNPRWQGKIAPEDLP